MYFVSSPHLLWLLHCKYEIQQGESLSLTLKLIPETRRKDIQKSIKHEIPTGFTASVGFIKVKNDETTALTVWDSLTLPQCQTWWQQASHLWEQTESAMSWQGWNRSRDIVGMKRLESDPHRDICLSCCRNKHKSPAQSYETVEQWTTYLTFNS